MDSTAMKRALRRLATEIVEKNHGAEELYLVGIRRRGVPLAERIRDKIESIENVRPMYGILDITLYRDDLSTVGTNPVVNRTELEEDIDGKTVVLIDDVLYTGRTIRALGGWAELAVIPTQKHMIAFGGSGDFARASDLEMGDREKNGTAYAVLRYKPKASLQLGLEYLYWKTVYKGMSDGTANRDLRPNVVEKRQHPARVRRACGLNLCSRGLRPRCDTNSRRTGLTTAAKNRPHRGRLQQKGYFFSTSGFAFSSTTGTVAGRTALPRMIAGCLMIPGRIAGSG